MSISTDVNLIAHWKLDENDGKIARNEKSDRLDFVEMDSIGSVHETYGDVPAGYTNYSFNDPNGNRTIEDNKLIISLNAVGSDDFIGINKSLLSNVPTLYKIRWRWIAYSATANDRVRLAFNNGAWSYVNVRDEQPIMGSWKETVVEAAGTGSSMIFALNIIESGSSATIEVDYIEVLNEDYGSLEGGLDFSNDSVAGATNNTGTGLEFDGVDDYVNGPKLDMGFDDRTISCWFKTDDLSYLAGLVGQHEAAGKPGRHGIMSNGNTNKILAIFDGNLIGIVAISNADLDDNVWHFAAATYDRDGDMVLYIDGEEEDRQDISFHSGVNMSPTNLNFDLGQYNAAGATPDNFFVGFLDEVRVHDKALSADEIRELYGTDLNERWPLSAYYKLDETIGSVAIDSIADNSGTYVNINPSTNSTNGLGGDLTNTAITFNGTDEYIDTNYSFSTITPFTLCAFIQFNDLSTDQCLFGLGGNSNFTFRRTSIGFWEVALGGFTNGIEAWRNGPEPTFKIDTPRHVAFTWDGSEIKMFVDGSETGSQTITSPVDTAYPIYIGRRDGGTGEYFNGAIDDVRIYSDDLTASEISGLYETLSYVAPVSNSGQNFISSNRMYSDVYLTRTGTQDIINTTGTNDGFQDLNNVSYAIYGTTYVESKPEYNPIELAALTGEYQDKFEAYLPEMSIFTGVDTYTTGNNTYANATSGLISNSGTVDGQQNLSNISVSLGKTVIRQDRQENSQVFIGSQTGTYQNRFERYYPNE